MIRSESGPHAAERPSFMDRLGLVVFLGVLILATARLWARPAVAKNASPTPAEA